MICVIVEVMLHNNLFCRPVTFSEPDLSYSLRIQGHFFKKTEQDITLWDWPGLADVKDPFYKSHNNWNQFLLKNCFSASG